MTTPLDNNNTSYKPFAKSNVDIDNNNEVSTLSAIDEEIIKRTTLLQLKEKLFNLPHTAKSTLVYAQAVTDIVNDDHLLGFLYVENYNVDVSVILYTYMCRESFYLQMKPPNSQHIDFMSIARPQYTACT